MIRNMKDSCIDWIGRIPETWQIHPVKHVLAERKEVNNPIIVTDILSLTNTRGVIPYAEKGEAGNKAKEDVSSYKIVRENDIVINSMNLYIGSVGLSKYTGVVSPVYYMLYKRNPLHSIDYFSLLFQTKELQSKSHGYGNGILDIRMRIPMSNLNTLPLPVPPTEEQHRIVSVLNKKTSQIDQLIAIQEQQIEKLKEYKQSVISKAVTKGLDSNVPMKDSGIEWIGDIPNNWNVLRLRYLGQTRSGISNLKPDQFGFGFPFLSYKNVYNNWSIDVNYDDLVDSRKEDRERFNIQKGDIFFTGSSETIEELGLSSVALRNWEQAVFNGFCIRLRPKNIDMCNPEFSKFYYRSQSCRAYLSAYDNSITRTNLSQATLKNMPVVIPPKHDQISIAEFLELFSTKIDGLMWVKNEKIKKYQEFKKTLIYEYVTGKREA